MEARTEKFKRLAEKRTNRILMTLKLLGNLSNRSFYAYSTEDINKIFKAIEEELRVTKRKFDDRKRPQFKL